MKLAFLSKSLWIAALMCMSSFTDEAKHELLIKWKDGPQSSAAEKGNLLIGSTVIRTFPSLGWQQIRLPAGMSVPEGISAFRAFTEVVFVEPNLVIGITPPVSDQPPSASVTDAWLSTSQTPSPISNDPRFSEQWFWRNIGATNAWATTTGSTNVIVAVLDGGINYRHEDLAPNMWRNPGEIAGNGLDDDDNGYVDDIYGIDTADNDTDPLEVGTGPARFHHGTVCAGLIGAAGNNGKGVVGMNWSVQLMAVRVATTNGTIAIADAVAAFEYVVLMKKRGANIRVTSNSYGTNPTTAYSQAMEDALAAAGREGILNVFAAGPLTLLDIDRVHLFQNRSSTSNMIVVGSTDRGNVLNSVFGQTAVDLVAPGVDMLSAAGPATNSYTGGTGTSFAAPLVAGAAALLLSVRADLSAADLQAAIFSSVDVLPGLRDKVKTGGKLNVGRAIEHVRQADPPPVVTSALPRGVRTAPTDVIQVTFSLPMNRTSVEAAFVIQPPLAGTFQWSDDSRVFTFQHTTLFDTATNYLFRIQATAQDDRGRTIDGNFNRTFETSPTDDYSWRAYFPIQNDDFARAAPITGDLGTVTSSNRYSSLELGEPFEGPVNNPQQGQTVWYKWKPDRDGWFTFDLAGTGFDSVLDIYAGNVLEQLAPVASNDNHGSRLASRTSFAASPQADYAIRIASKHPFDPTYSGRFTLSWYPSPPPGLTGTQFVPTTGVPGTRVTINGTNFTGATAVLFNGVPASFTNAPTNNVDLRITAFVPREATTGPITIQTPHGNVTSTNNFEVMPVLFLSQTAEAELTLSWADTSLIVESSADLISWEPVSTPQAGSAVVVMTDGRRFFRLYRP